MGLITSVDNIQRELEKQKKQQLIDKIQRQKERQHKENLKRYKSEIEIFLKKEFDKYFEIAGSDYIVEFYDRERKKEILNNYFDTIQEIDSNGFERIPYKNELEQHFYNKYNTILTKALKEQKQQELYNLQQIPIQEAETKKEKIRFDWLSMFLLIGKIILGIIFLPALLIFFIILGCFKYMK